MNLAKEYWCGKSSKGTTVRTFHKLPPLYSVCCEAKVTCGEKKVEAHLGKINKTNTSCQYHVYQLGHDNKRINRINLNEVYSVNVMHQIKHLK